MKNFIKLILHKSLGFKNYLFSFALFKIYTIQWDKKENDFFHFIKLIPENTLVLDIGANIGIMSVILCRKIKNIEVYSFEPVPVNSLILNRILSFFKIKNIKVFNYALGNEDKKAEMFMPVLNSVKMQGLSHVVHHSIQESKIGEKFKTEMKKLDNVPELAVLGKRISAIKIDVENFEYYVLDGAREIIKKHKPVIYIELWENDNRYKCFDLIKNLGYKIYVVFGEEIKEYEPAIHHTQNFLFIHS